MITKEGILACINGLNLNANPHESIWKGKVKSYSKKNQGCMGKEKKSVIKLQDYSDGQTYKLVGRASDLSTNLLNCLQRECQVYYLFTRIRPFGSEPFLFE